MTICPLTFGQKDIYPFIQLLAKKLAHWHLVINTPDMSRATIVLITFCRQDIYLLQNNGAAKIGLFTFGQQVFYRLKIVGSLIFGQQGLYRHQTIGDMAISGITYGQQDKYLLLRLV